MTFDYKEKSVAQLQKNFSERAREGKNGFTDLADFLDWYNSQEKNCHYCGLTEMESQEIVMTGLLTSTASKTLFFSSRMSMSPTLPLLLSEEV